MIRYATIQTINDNHIQLKKILKKLSPAKENPKKNLFNTKVWSMKTQEKINR
jgi:hypothetical protein